MHSGWVCQPVAPLALGDDIFSFVWLLGLSEFSFLTILQFHICTLPLSFSLTQESVLELDFIVKAHVVYPDTKRYEKGFLIPVNIYGCY